MGSLANAVGQAATGAITLAQAGIAEGLQQLANAIVSGRRRQLLAGQEPLLQGAGGALGAVDGPAGPADSPSVRVLLQVLSPQPETVADRVRAAVDAGGLNLGQSASDTVNGVVNTVTSSLSDSLRNVING